MKGKHILVADDARAALESGMDARIAKPVQIENLKSTIRQVLDSRLKQLPDSLVFGGFPITNTLKFKKPLV